MTGAFMYYNEKVSYYITEENKDKIIKILLKYYEEHSYIEEAIQQDDDALLEAPNILSYICDNLISFTTEESI